VGQCRERIFGAESKTVCRLMRLQEKFRASLSIICTTTISLMLLLTIIANLQANLLF